MPGWNLGPQGARASYCHEVQIDLRSLVIGDIKELRIKTPNLSTFEGLKARLAEILRRPMTSFDFFEEGDVRQPIPTWAVVRQAKFYAREAPEVPMAKELLHVEIPVRGTDIFVHADMSMTNMDVKGKDCYGFRDISE